MSVTIQSLRFNNFKRFDKFHFSARTANILVGPNNSGKSSILDALRVAFACLRYTRSTSPRAIDIPGRGAFLGYQLPTSSLPVPLANVATNYSEKDAIIEIKCSNGNQLVIHLNPERPTTFYAVSETHHLRTSKQFREAIPLDLIIVPPLGPFDEIENYVTDETVQRNESSRLSNRYFRNIWLRKLSNEFAELSRLISDSWPGIEIKPAEMVHGQRPFVQMFFTENRIDREVYWSGFGFQVWLQVLTHILRGQKTSILVLDEPDIYLHPDLQRKLLHIIGRQFSQFFVATHSVEIINEADTGDVSSINPKHRTAKRISSEDDYQGLFNYIGSYENIDFSRLARAKRIVFFEGKDRKLLKKFASKIGADQFAHDTDTTVLQAGGFGQWRRVKDVAWTFREVLKLDVRMFVIFDRDYRSSEEIQSFLSNMEAEGLHCCVLKRKELENYALSHAALKSAICKRQEEKLTPSEQLADTEITAIIDEISDTFGHDTFSQIVGHQIRFLQSVGSPLDLATISRETLIKFQKDWHDINKRMEIIPGKDFISSLSTALQRRKGFTLTINMIVDAMSASDIAVDLKDLINKLDRFSAA